MNDPTHEAVHACRRPVARPPAQAAASGHGRGRMCWLAAALALLMAMGAVADPGTDGGPLADARQLVLVHTAGWDAATGTLTRFERDGPDGRDWRRIGVPVAVTLGRAGAAWGIGLHDAQPGPQKREGDGRSPAGVFALGTAFGYAPDDATALGYMPMQAGHWCIDVGDSPLYNRIVDATELGEAAVAGSTEPMRRDLHANGDQRYRLGFVIEHNPDGVPQAGSCIFAHLWGAPGQLTAGCTAMDEAAMRALLDWLDPARQPRFVLLPAAEYTRVRHAWALPDPPEDD